MRVGTALFFADELDINLLPKVGYQWMPKGEQVEVLTPGTNAKRYLLKFVKRMAHQCSPSYSKLTG